MVEMVAIKVTFALAESLPIMGKLPAMFSDKKCPLVVAGWLKNGGGGWI